MKILVTGSAGFIGFHLSKSLLIDGHEVLGIDNLNDYYDPNLKLARLEQLKPYKNFKFNKVDIADKESLTLSFKSFKPKKVVNQDLGCLAYGFSRSQGTISPNIQNENYDYIYQIHLYNLIDHGK